MRIDLESTNLPFNMGAIKNKVQNPLGQSLDSQSLFFGGKVNPHFSMERLTLLRIGEIDVMKKKVDNPAERTLDPLFDQGSIDSRARFLDWLTLLREGEMDVVKRKAQSTAEHALDSQSFFCGGRTDPRAKYLFQ
jgi:hypothetical protein